MSNRVDPFRYLDGITKTIVKAWVRREPRSTIPWSSLGKPLSECTVALVSSAGVRLHDDTPFDQEGERRNPWWGDPTHRIIQKGVSGSDIVVDHLHINPVHPETDLNCVLPIERLEELCEEGLLGAVAQSHYSFMGFILRPEKLLDETTPEIVARMKGEEVDAVVLVPS